MSPLQTKLLARLAQLKLGSTLCPGRLARDCGTTLAAARADLLTLAEQGRIALTQRGRAVTASTLRGPYRVALIAQPNPGAKESL